MTQDWNIRARGHCCSSSGSTFGDGTQVYSRLLFTDEGYVREDYAEAEWSDDLRADAVSFWHSTYRAPAPPKPEPLKKENAESLLRRLIETEEEINRNAIFILAVMLERRRILVERDTHRREDGVKVRVYEHKQTGESFLIPDPELRLAELGEVQEEVVGLLGGQQSAAADRGDGPQDPASASAAGA